MNARLPLVALTLALPLWLLAPPRSASACLHAADDYPGTVGESGQQALIFYEDGREELILKVDYRFGGEAGAPASLAWVIPVPSAPDDYGVTSPKVFEELWRLQQQARNEKYPPRNKGTLGGEEEDLTFLSKVSVGDYTIQPIQGAGAAAGPALNKWLAENGFGEVPVENMKYYLDRGWTFLAVKAVNGGSWKQDGGLQPLRISFAADRIYYPLKFSSHQGIFKVTLYVITRDGLDVEALAPQLKTRGFSLADPQQIELKPAKLRTSPALVKLWKELHKSKRIKFTSGVMHQIMSSYGVNRPDNPLSDWEEDFSLPAPAGK